MLSHADWRLDNLFFTDDDDVIAVDWQLIDRSVGPARSLVPRDPERQHRRPRRLPAARSTHTSRISPSSASTSTATWAWEMYRYGTMLGFVYPVIATGAITIANDRHVELTRALFRRSLAALDALDAFALPL